MADNNRDRYEDRWNEREHNRDPRTGERLYQEQDRERQSQFSSGIPQRVEAGQRERWEDRGYENQGDYSRRESYGRNDDRGERQDPSYDYEMNRGERGYASTDSGQGQSNFRSHLDSHREQKDRGFGATSSGVNWGATSMGRHRLGSLTESAARTARYRPYEAHQQDPNRPSYAGRGPKGYKRTDERLQEEISERLVHDHDVDASDIEVNVIGGVVTLSGTVQDRQSKRIAEDLAEEVWGVTEVQNQIRVNRGSVDASTTSTSSLNSDSSQTSSSASAAGGRGDTVFGTKR